MRFNTKKISALNIHNYVKDIFVTFDIDWAPDKVLTTVIDFIESMDIHATWFITHDTKLLSILRENRDFELAIHPNFNNRLFQKNTNNDKNAEKIIHGIKEIVPEAVTFRSHCLTQNYKLSETLYELGFRYDCNTFIPIESDIVIKPYLDIHKLIKVNHFFADDAFLIYKSNYTPNKYLQHAGLKVFGFHPIHLFLNTFELNQYREAKKYFRNYKKLKTFVNKKRYGVRDFLVDLVYQIKHA